MIASAFRLAHEAHGSIGQVRKYTGDPYHLHPWAVAGLVMLETTDEWTIAAAALHDVLEDVPTVELSVEYWAGKIVGATHPRVLDLVQELTHVYTTENHPKLNRAERKRLEAERISRTSEAARLIKTCDNLDNIKTIGQHDPKFAKTYVAEMRLYYDALPLTDSRRELDWWMLKIEAAPLPPAPGAR